MDEEELQNESVAVTIEDKDEYVRELQSPPEARGKLKRRRTYTEHWNISRSSDPYHEVNSAIPTKGFVFIKGRMEKVPRSSGKVEVPATALYYQTVPSSTIVVEDVENPAATAKIEEIKEYCIKIEDFLQKLEQSPKAEAEVSAFFRVPPHMRDRDKVYDPKHINFSRLTSMLVNSRPDDKERKLLSHYYRHLQSILKENKKSFTDCMEMMDHELKREEILKNVSSRDYPAYLLALLLSGCFIIDLIRRWSIDELSPEYDQECGGIWASELWVDLLLVENQIPFFILRSIKNTMPPFFIIAGHRFKLGTLEEEVFNFYKDFLPLKNPKEVNQHMEPVHHLLHFVHQSLLPGIKEKQYKLFWRTIKRIYVFLSFIDKCIGKLRDLTEHHIDKCIGKLWDRTKHRISTNDTCANWFANCFSHCFEKIATERWKEYTSGWFRTPAVLTTAVPTARRLQEAGIQFKSVKMKGFVVEFKKGVLWLPRLHLRSNTYKCFMNLIAWEHCYPTAGKYFTNFVIFMDYLINDSKDVEVLIHSGVLEHSLSTDDEVVKVFDNLVKDLVYTYDKKYDFLTKLFGELNFYRENKLNTWRANLMNEYFKSPWSIISVLAALFVILLTATQTFFAVFSYFRPFKLNKVIGEIFAVSN